MWSYGEDEFRAYRELVRRYFTQLGITQREFARRLRKSPTYVSRLLSGDSLGSHTLSDLKTFAAALTPLPQQQDAVLRSVFNTGTIEEVEAYHTLLYHSTYIKEDNSQRKEKNLIADRLVTEERLIGHERGDETIFLDSGSTITAVTRAIVAHQVHPGSYITNNFVASFYLANSHIPSILIGGQVQYDNILGSYGALLGTLALKDLDLLRGSLTTTLMSVTSLSYEDGLFSRHPDNVEFKEHLIRNSISDRRRLIVLADFRKFISRDFHDRQILPNNEWLTLRDELDNWILVVGGEPEEGHQHSGKFKHEVEQFATSLGSRLICVIK